MPQTIFVYESLTAGAYRQELSKTSLLAEGGAMAAAIILDIAALDDCRVVTVWGSRLRRLTLPNFKTFVVDSDDEDRSYFQQCCEQADRILIIAPEAGETLQMRLCKARAIKPDAVLNVTSDALTVGCDKWELAQFCQQHSIPHLPTEMWTGQSFEKSPVILKPRDGVGCEEIRIVHEPPIPSDIDSSGRMILQPFVQGIPLSSAACFCSAGERRLTLPLGEQQLYFAESIEYQGGRIPWDDPCREDAESQAEDIWSILERELSGLRGYLGIDWIWEVETQSLRLVELNPRLTTSYIGYRKLFGRQIAEAILEHPLSPCSSNIQNVQFAASPETVLPLPGERI